MKKLIVIIACILLFTPPLFAQDTMKLVYYNDFAPFSWEGSDKQMQGVLIDVINEVIQKQMDIQVSHKGYQWALAQKKSEMERRMLLLQFRRQPEKNIPKLILNLSLSGK